jgi:hypothetical protein
MTYIRRIYIYTTHSCRGVLEPLGISFFFNKCFNIVPKQNKTKVLSLNIAYYLIIKFMFHLVNLVDRSLKTN